MERILQSHFWFFLPILEIILLFYVSKKLINKIAVFIHTYSISRRMSTYLLALLFLPGTYFHEFSHLIAAKLLFVPVYSFTIFPIVEEDSIRLGSVEIAKTDFIRRALIGTAPLIIGILTLLSSTYYLLHSVYMNTWWGICLLAFVTFQIGNTMFLSKRDTEGLWKIAVLILIVIGLLFYAAVDWYAGIRLLQSFIDVFRTLSTYLLIPIILDVAFIVFLSIVT